MKLLIRVFMHTVKPPLPPLAVWMARPQCSSLTWKKENWGPRLRGHLLFITPSIQTLDLPLRKWRIHPWISLLVPGTSEESSFVIRRTDVLGKSLVCGSFSTCYNLCIRTQGSCNSPPQEARESGVFPPPSFYVWPILGRGQELEQESKCWWTFFLNCGAPGSNICY